MDSLFFSLTAIGCVNISFLKDNLIASCATKVCTINRLALVEVPLSRPWTSVSSAVDDSSSRADSGWKKILRQMEFDP